MLASRGEISKLLATAGSGDATALERLMPIVYDELRRLAASYMRRERPGHTLQATALVNEAYLRLIHQRQINWENRVQFFAVAAQLMRRVLVDHARKKWALKRGGDVLMVPFDDDLAVTDGNVENLLALDEALNALEKIDERQARIVELRFFGGLSGDETAETLQVAPRTVDREWKLAQAWLRRALTSRNHPREGRS